jgi:dienelactone hydrolase
MRRFAPATAFILVVLCALSIGCRAAAPAAGSTLRDDFRRLLLADRKPDGLNPKMLSQTDMGTVRVERVRFTTEAGPGGTAIAVIQRPKEDGKYPAVIVQHFMGGSKDHIALAPMTYMLAKRGYVVAAIDGRYRGERQNGTSLEAAMVAALRTGKGRPFLIDTAYDVLRLVDYLETRPDVDRSRIGMTGFSEGGIITWMCAAVDDRIRVAVPIIGVTSFNDTFQAVEGPDLPARIKLFEPVLKEYAKDLGEPGINAKVLRGAWEKLVPGMLDRFDAPNIVPLIAPRPLLILSHEQDELFPIEGARKVYAAAKARYQELKAEDRLEFRIAAGQKHSSFDVAELTGTVSWMERWLKVPPP